MKIVLSLLKMRELGRSLGNCEGWNQDWPIRVPNPAGKPDDCRDVILKCTHFCLKVFRHANIQEKLIGFCYFCCTLCSLPVESVLTTELLQAKKCCIYDFWIWDWSCSKKFVKWSGFFKPHSRFQLGVLKKQGARTKAILDYVTF